MEPQQKMGNVNSWLEKPHRKTCLLNFISLRNAGKLGSYSHTLKLVAQDMPTTRTLNYQMQWMTLSRRRDVTTHKPPRKTSGGTGEFDLLDYFDSPLERTTRPAKATTGPYPRKPDEGRWNIPHTTTTKQPKTTKPPPKKAPGKDPMDLDLTDALDDQNDRHPGGGPPKGNPGGGISDDDLTGIVNEGGYQPDKKKGDSDNDYNNGALVETGTIAGIVSGLAMALIGAVSSYISYQQKKFCFSIQQGLNAEYVKGENMEAVVTEEPQGPGTCVKTRQEGTEPHFLGCCGDR
ncbi:hypothetical protein L345_14468, partial [Ophiophagus hannah]